MKTIIIKADYNRKSNWSKRNIEQFSFVVDPKANKIEIKNAVEKMYGVQVTEVRTMNYGGGKSSTKYTNRGIVEQKAKRWKKAIVTVADGETIDLFNNF